MSRQTKRNIRSGNPQKRAASAAHLGGSVRHTEAVNFIDQPLPGMRAEEPKSDERSAARDLVRLVESIEALELAAGAVQSASQDLAEAVGSARLAGLSWASIGQALGLDRETARRRFGSTVQGSASDGGL
jgi:DNA-directed RNA polymerase specialized sigma24 family protein